MSKQRKPLVSIIIPALNEEEYIGKTLKNVKEQDYDNLEVIVVDNGSEDRTKEIARKYADKIVVERKRGIARARNAGARFASGDILLFLDADTLLEPEAVREIAKAFRERCVVCVSLFLDCQGKWKYKLLYNLYSICTWLLSLIGYSRFPGGCLAVRRDVFLRIGGFDEGLYFYEDSDFCERVSKLGRCRFLRKVHAYTSPRKFEKFGLLRFALFLIKTYLIFKFCRNGSSILAELYLNSKPQNSPYSA